MDWINIFGHLVPRSAAWSLDKNKTLRKFFEGLTAGPETIRTYVDEIWRDRFPQHTRAIDEHEDQLGLHPLPTATEQERRDALDAEYQARGGQDPTYLQNVLQAAGFALYVHDWWVDGTSYTPKDPRTYTNQPLIGTYQCAPYSMLITQPQAQCSPGGIDFPGQPQCNAWLLNYSGANAINYLVNRDLTRRAPPPIPDDPNLWPYFWYVGGETFPNTVQVPRSRQPELERLLLKMGPTEKWIVHLIEWVEDVEIFDDSFDDAFS